MVDRLDVRARYPESVRAVFNDAGFIESMWIGGREPLPDGEVEYVRADLHRGAVDLLREARGYVARHSGEKPAAELYDRIASALDRPGGQCAASPRMEIYERIEGELLDAMHARAVANAEGRTDAPSVRDMAVKAASIADDHYRGAVEALEEIASYHEHGKYSALTPGYLARKAQRALDNLQPGGQCAAHPRKEQP